MIINELPPEHELRNIPLAGSFYKRAGDKFCREVMPSFGITNKCFNDLRGPWLDDIFSFDKEALP